MRGHISLLDIIKYSYIYRLVFFYLEIVVNNSVTKLKEINSRILPAYKKLDDSKIFKVNRKVNW